MECDAGNTTFLFDNLTSTPRDLFPPSSSGLDIQNEGLDLIPCIPIGSPFKISIDADWWFVGKRRGDCMVKGEMGGVSFVPGFKQNICCV